MVNPGKYTRTAPSQVDRDSPISSVNVHDACAEDSTRTWAIPASSLARARTSTCTDPDSRVRETTTTGSRRSSATSQLTRGSTIELPSSTNRASVRSPPSSTVNSRSSVRTIAGLPNSYSSGVSAEPGTAAKRTRIPARRGSSGRPGATSDSVASMRQGADGLAPSNPMVVNKCSI
jgi:hypothetical protein